MELEPERPATFNVLAHRWRLLFASRLASSAEERARDAAEVVRARAELNAAFRARSTVDVCENCCERQCDVCMGMAEVQRRSVIVADAREHLVNLLERKKLAMATLRLAIVSAVPVCEVHLLMQIADAALTQPAYHFLNRAEEWRNSELLHTEERNSELLRTEARAARKEPSWHDSACCMAAVIRCGATIRCDAVFTSGTSEHHCRYCGYAVCGACLSGDDIDVHRWVSNTDGHQLSWIDEAGTAHRGEIPAWVFGVRDRVALTPKQVCASCAACAPAEIADAMEERNFRSVVARTAQLEAVENQRIRTAVIPGRAMMQRLRSIGLRLGFFHQAAPPAGLHLPRRLGSLADRR